MTTGARSTEKPTWRRTWLALPVKPLGPSAQTTDSDLVEKKDAVVY
jgi:hypothetical protein